MSWYGGESQPHEVFMVVKRSTTSYHCDNALESRSNP